MIEFSYPSKSVENVLTIISSKQFSDQLLYFIWIYLGQIIENVKLPKWFQMKYVWIYLNNFIRVTQFKISGYCQVQTYSPSNFCKLIGFNWARIPAKLTQCQHFKNKWVKVSYIFVKIGGIWLNFLIRVNQSKMFWQ